MDATELHKLVVQGLNNSGFMGIIPIARARDIVQGVTSSYKNTNFDITIELSPIHNVGKPMTCDCAKTKIIIKPKRTTSKVQTGLPSSPKSPR
jgi:hypothetical protein